MNQAENNLKLMKLAWVEELIKGLGNIEQDMGDVIIKSILRSQKLKRVAQPLSGPVIKQIYNIFLKDLKDKTIKQLDVFIQAAREMDTTNLEELVDKYRKDYLKLDMAAQNLSKKHRNYDQIIDYQIQTFKHRILETRDMMQIPDAKSYDEILKGTYPTYKKARRELFKQIGYTQKAINVIISDMSILKIPEILKHPVINVLKMGYKNTLEYLTNICKDLYNA